MYFKEFPRPLNDYNGGRKTLMKTRNKKSEKYSAILATAAATTLPANGPDTVLAVGAESEKTDGRTGTDTSRIKALLTDYLPQVIEHIDPYSGFTHPGVGVTKELLENLQTQLRAGEEPWKSYFEIMLLDTWFSGKDVMPSRDGGAFDNRQFITDSSRAYAQALLYFITGDNSYRKNAMRIIRAYEDIDPNSLEYFTDACIHTGIPTNKICIAAEILRYSTYRLTNGYMEADLTWTDEDTRKFICNFLNPEIDVFQSSPDRFMNQHLYTTIGAMSAYLFMDDADSYARSVEWFTVNKGAYNQGFNGSIKRLFREITTLDEVGQKEGCGTPLEKPVIQHVEMGRDQAHGCGDLTNSAILSRLMQGQGTKVDPIDGTVSTASNAVDCYAFLDDRMLKAADFFFRYMLGYDTEWISVPFSMKPDGTIIDSYAAFSANYRGRYKTINFWDFYTYYIYNRNMSKEELQTQYPYFYDGYIKKIYTSWDNPDGGGDFWVFLPPAAKGDTSFIPSAAEANIIEVENRGTLVSGHSASGVRKDTDGTSYFHLDQTDGKSRIAMNSAGICSELFLFRVRTDGLSSLTMHSGSDGTIYLPDTKGEWVYVPYPRHSDEIYGDMYYFSVTKLEGCYVDVDAIYTNPRASALDAITFDCGREDYNLTTYIDAPFSITLSAKNITDTPVRYSGLNLPDGTIINETDGTVNWSPSRTGDYIFYISASAGNTIAVKKLAVTVSCSRMDAVRNASKSFDSAAAYTSVSLKTYEDALNKAAKSAEEKSVSDTGFTAMLNELSNAVARLELVSPLLKNDPLTDGTSLDFRKMNIGNRSTFSYGDTSNWLDAEPGTFVGYWLVENKGCIMDFGNNYKISVNKFGFQARAGFSDRLAGVQVYGSNDRVNWDKLTVTEAAYKQVYQTVDVHKEYHDKQYRYLMFKKTTEYPDALSNSCHNLLEFGELRIWGVRYETGNLPENLSIQS